MEGAFGSPPLLMPTFTTPIVHDAPSTSADMTEEEEHFWSFYNGRARGQTVLKIGGVYTEVTVPSQDQIDSCDWITLTTGERIRAAYLGGHIYPIDDTEATALIAAGYGDYVEQEGGFAQGYGGGY